MKYFIVHTPSYCGSYEGRTPVAASTAEKAVQKYCAYLDLGKPPARYYAVEITKEEFDALPERCKIF
jgi:hypothetical protein